MLRPGGRPEPPVEVVARQAVGVQAERVAALGLAEGAEERPVVVGGEEDPAAVVTRLRAW
jgi:hypothetical protein